MKFFKTLIFILIFSNAPNSYSQFSPPELYSKGLEKFYSGDFQEAVKFFTDYINVATNLVNGYNYRGLSFLAMNNYTRALEDFTSIIAMNNSNYEAYTNRGYTYYLQGNFSSANADFVNSIQYGPNYLEGYIGKCRVNIATNNLNLALKDMNSASGVEPKNPRVYINNAFIYFLMNDTLKFFENINTALYFDSNIVFTSFERDLIFLKVEIYKRILVTADAAVQNNPNDFVAYFARGFLYYLMNRYSEATDDLKTSVKLNKINNPLYINTVKILLRSIDRNS
ncbi:MAG TPA: tetratricopeptide repeat protein [Ignavibacteria bacterium]|nr:tetratricopeptide repeat protein [Ignavibacteria bacterium]